jgi:hypothetical protein
MKRKHFLGAALLTFIGLTRGKLPVVPEPPVLWEAFPVEGTFLYSDGGTFEWGIVRDSALNSTGDYRIFAETWEGVTTEGLPGVTHATTAWS